MKPFALLLVAVTAFCIWTVVYVYTRNIDLTQRIFEESVIRETEL